MTSSLPDVPEPLKLELPAVTDPVHDVALDDDHVNVTTAPLATDDEDALKLIEGAGVVGVGAELPPPPPPPQLEIINTEINK